MEDLCRFALKSVHSFSKYSVHKLVTDEQTDRRTDEGIGREHYASGQSTDIRINTVFAVGVLRSCCSPPWGRGGAGEMGEGRGI